jgi:hypothetical protein
MLQAVMSELTPLVHNTEAETDQAHMSPAESASHCAAECEQVKVPAQFAQDPRAARRALRRRQLGNSDSARQLGVAGPSSAAHCRDTGSLDKENAEKASPNHSERGFVRSRHQQPAEPGSTNDRFTNRSAPRIFNITPDRLLAESSAEQASISGRAEPPPDERHAAVVACADALLADVLALLTGTLPAEAPGLPTPEISTCTLEAGPGQGFGPAGLERSAGAAGGGLAHGAERSSAGREVCRSVAASAEHTPHNAGDDAATALIHKCLLVHGAAQAALSRHVGNAACEAGTQTDAAGTAACFVPFPGAPEVSYVEAEPSGEAAVAASSHCAGTEELAALQAHVAQAEEARTAAHAAAAEARDRCAQLEAALAERRREAAAAAAAVAAQRAAGDALRAHVCDLQAQLDARGANLQAAAAHAEQAGSDGLQRHAAQRTGGALARAASNVPVALPPKVVMHAADHDSEKRGTAGSMRALLAMLDSASTFSRVASTAPASVRGASSRSHAHAVGSYSDQPVGAVPGRPASQAPQDEAGRALSALDRAAAGTAAALLRGMPPASRRDAPTQRYSDAGTGPDARPGHQPRPLACSPVRTDAHETGSCGGEPASPAASLAGKRHSACGQLQRHQRPGPGGRSGSVPRAGPEMGARLLSRKTLLRMRSALRSDG